MATYTFPSIVPNRTQISLLSNTLIHTSPFTGAIQTVDRGGERWQMTLSYFNLNTAKANELAAFLARLNGQQHRFTMRNHAEANQGAFGGTPLVDGASQTGNALFIDGCSNSVTDWMKAGDWFGVNGELKIATLDVDSGPTGSAILNFAPRLRTSPANNDPITTSQATGVFMLADNGVSWAYRPGPFTDLTIRAIEDIAV